MTITEDRPTALISPTVTAAPINRFRLDNLPHRWRVSAGVALVLLALGGWAWQHSRHQNEQAVLAARTAPVQRQDVVINVSATGSIKPITPVNISPKQPGRLSELLVDQGDRVRAGQILARMDASNLRGELLRAQGSLAAAEANLQKVANGNRNQDIQQAAQNLREAEAQLIAVRSVYLSNQQLYGSGAVARVTADASRSAFLAAQARVRALRAQSNLQRVGSRPEDLAAARAQVLQARGALTTVQAQVNDTLIRAPFAGLVTQKYADVGAFVTPTTSASATTSATSSSILALAGELEAVANVSEIDVASIHPGQPVELQLDAYPGQRFRGTVRRVAPEAVVAQNVTSFQVRIALATSDDPRLRSGMNLTARFLVGRRPQALLIPTPAIVSRQGGTGVYVLEAGGKPRFRRVRAGATIGAQTEILSGLRDGQRVYVTFPGRRQPNGRPVRSSSPLGQPQGGGRAPR